MCVYIYIYVCVCVCVCVCVPKRERVSVCERERDRQTVRVSLVCWLFCFTAYQPFFGPFKDDLYQFECFKIFIFLYMHKYTFCFHSVKSKTNSIQTIQFSIGTQL